MLGRNKGFTETHTGNRLFACIMCNERFNRKGIGIKFHTHSEENLSFAVIEGLMKRAI